MYIHGEKKIVIHVHVFIWRRKNFDLLACAYIRQKSPMNPHRSPRYPQKSLMNQKKSPINLQKSPMHAQKSPVNPQKSLIICTYGGSEGYSPARCALLFQKNPTAKSPTIPQKNPQNIHIWGSFFKRELSLSLARCVWAAKKSYQSAKEPYESAKEP